MCHTSLLCQCMSQHDFGVAHIITQLDSNPRQQKENTSLVGVLAHLPGYQFLVPLSHTLLALKSGPFTVIKNTKIVHCAIHLCFAGACPSTTLASPTSLLLQFCQGSRSSPYSSKSVCLCVQVWRTPECAFPLSQPASTTDTLQYSIVEYTILYRTYFQFPTALQALHARCVMFTLLYLVLYILLIFKYLNLSNPLIL